MSDIKVSIKSDGTNAGTRIIDEATGYPLGAVQKMVFEVDVNTAAPKVTLEVVNLNSDIKNVIATIEPVLFGQFYKTIEEMTPEEIILALRWEAKQRYLAQFMPPMIIKPLT